MEFWNLMVYAISHFTQATKLEWEKVNVDSVFSRTSIGQAINGRSSDEEQEL